MFVDSPLCLLASGRRRSPWPVDRNVALRRKAIRSISRRPVGSNEGKHTDVRQDVFFVFVYDCGIACVLVGAYWREPRRRLSLHASTKIGYTHVNRYCSGNGTRAYPSIRPDEDQINRSPYFLPCRHLERIRPPVTVGLISLFPSYCCLCKVDEIVMAAEDVNILIFSAWGVPPQKQVRSTRKSRLKPTGYYNTISSATGDIYIYRSPCRSTVSCRRWWERVG